MRVVPFLLILAACTGGAHDSDHATGHCEAAPYQAGMALPTDQGLVQLSLLQADPDPPDEGRNQWTLGLDAATASVLDASVRVRPWMPDHDHGLSPEWYAGSPDGAGQILVEPFDLIMPGRWEFVFEVSIGEQTDTARVAFCIEG